MENAPEGSRGLYASWQTASQAAGVLLGGLVTMRISLSMTPAQLEAWGWRGPFVIGLLIVPVGLYVRAKLDEPELFQKVRKEAPGLSAPKMLSIEPHALLTGIGIAVLYLAAAYVLFVYMHTFAVRQLKHDGIRLT
ncbi:MULTISPECIES: hypothetical protein [unclassified Bradyrhizobium]|uniref:hypothetical protein n=1 Tax=unclassified Bradyrhizobium TaxID=2631580 RepID=UPI0024790B24|nr:MULTISPECIES: hypothetical protein [unclassified Bradyrhizobium]WGS19468.1 hypothetical protein MTX22_34650 [Bradyrhizobium sp. ISRA463]WGS26306.1 hypothetical protein MTX19_32140 [Bradyrhizobium sp. ISRA464]